MDEIKIDTANSETSEDATREEMKWNSGHEIIIQNWAERCRLSAKKHYTNGKKKKLLFHVFSVIATCVPLIATFLPHNNDIENAAFVFISCLNGIITVFNWGNSYGNHFHFEASYNDLATALECEMKTPRRLRQQVDVFLHTNRMRVARLDESAPDV